MARPADVKDATPTCWICKSTKWMVKRFGSLKCERPPCIYARALAHRDRLVDAACA